LHAEEGTPEDMEVATQGGMVVTLVATQDIIMEVISATSLEGLQEAHRQGVTFTNQNPCAPTDKISEDCPQLGEKQWQTIPAEKAQNRFESRFE
jgi:hypothetical protein